MTRFTREARLELLEAIRGGLTLVDACETTGLAVDTVKGWLKRGRRESETEYAVFVEAVDRAREDAAAAEMSVAEFRAHLNAAVASWVGAGDEGLDRIAPRGRLVAGLRSVRPV